MADKVETPPAEAKKPDNAVDVAKKKLANLQKLGGVAGVNPFYAINALNKALADLQSKNAEEVAAAKATIEAVTDDGKWLPKKL